jgi:hypothetical protein
VDAQERTKNQIKEVDNNCRYLQLRIKHITELGRAFEYNEFGIPYCPRGNENVGRPGTDGAEVRRSFSYIIPVRR